MGTTAQRPSASPFLALSICAITRAQAGPAAITAVKKTPTEVVLTLASGVLEVAAIERARHPGALFGGQTRGGSELRPDRTGATPKFEVQEDEQTIRVSVAKMQAVVDRATGTVSFRDEADHVFLAEEAGARSLLPKTVQGQPTFAVGQGFRVRARREALRPRPVSRRPLGLARHPARIASVNTQIALPVLISSKGYGLLWDNASPTDFNPADNEIPLTAAMQPLTCRRAHGHRAIHARARAKRAIACAAAHSLVRRRANMFSSRDGDRRNEIAILVDGKEIAGREQSVDAALRRWENHAASE